MPGAPFCPNGGGERHMRINFSHATPERMDKGIRRLAELVEESSGRPVAEADYA